MNLTQALRSIARSNSALPGITSDTARLTYGEFEHQVGCIAGALLDHHGLAHGQRVGIVMENCAEYLPVLFGIWRAGLAAVPVNAKLHPKELAWILENSGARLSIATPEMAARISAQSGASWPTTIVTGTADYRALLLGYYISERPGSPEDEAWLFYTSGTTGRPKGAILTHRNVTFATHAYYADIDFVDERDCYIHAAPLSHGSGFYGLAHVAKGSHAIIHDGFEPDRVLDCFATMRNVSMFAAPTMVVRLLNSPKAGGDTRGLKTISYGGAPMYVADLKRGLELFGPKFYQLYGQGEAPMTITGLTKAMHADSSHPNWEQRLGSAGIARTGCAFKIAGEDGRESPLGEVGEIITKSDCVMKGYWANPEANAKSLRDGWLWTGDLGSVDADGFLTIKDRSKDMIISGGSNIYPREIEEVLLTHAAVLECAVVSRPHPDWGEEVIAYVVKRPGMDVSAQQLDQLCLDNIARFKRPKGYRFAEALPKNNYGKILKTELRELLKQQG